MTGGIGPIRRHHIGYVGMICAYWDGGDSSKIKGLRAAFNGCDPQVIPFDSVEQLATTARRRILDIVVIPATGLSEQELEIAQQAKAIPALLVIPVVMWHDCPDEQTVQRIAESDIDDLVSGCTDSPAAHARLRAILRRSQRDLDVNPSSRLPGPTTVERILHAKLASKEDFALCYADLDDFKAYNDYYGYFYGDRVIKMTSRIVRETVFEFQPDGFVGHIGGDDFVFIVDPKRVEKLCDTIIKRFDAEIGFCYDPRDRRNGYIISHNRRRVAETYPLMGLSIAIVINRDDTFQHVGELSHMVADLKKYAKTLPGSNYVVERRSKY
ncbi:MAG: diguanylate cyclase [candidate division Zixibacteria bacterium]|nr:diguanylate cyclase [candidate division Zixibacteria bacterium]